jgi:hypothetical protein
MMKFYVKTLNNNNTNSKIILGFPITRYLHQKQVYTFVRQVFVQFLLQDHQEGLLTRLRNNYHHYY